MAETEPNPLAETVATPDSVNESEPDKTMVLSATVAPRAIEGVIGETESSEPEKPKVAPPVAARPRLSGFLPERFVRRILDKAGSAVDRTLGRTEEASGTLTTSQLVAQLKDQIDRRVRDEGKQGRIAPHVIKLKVEWGKHDDAPNSLLKNLEYELQAAAIDHINDKRYRTLAPVKVEIESDVFTKSISVLPTFGDFEEELERRDERARAAASGAVLPDDAPPVPTTVTVMARVSRPGIESHEVPLTLEPGGKRVSIGRGADNTLRLVHNSVSKVHAALVMKPDGSLWVSDIGSTNGTFLNGRRLSYGEARPIVAGDVIAFGEVEVRLH